MLLSEQPCSLIASVAVFVETQPRLLSCCCRIQLCCWCVRPCALATRDALMPTVVSPFAFARAADSSDSLSYPPPPPRLPLYVLSYRQFSVTSPVRRTDAEGRLRNRPWFRARPSSSFGSAGEDDGSTCVAGSSTGAFGNGNGSDGGGDGSRRRGRAGRYGNGSSGNSASSSPVPAGGGLADAGLDFLGTTDSVRDLLHLPYTRCALAVTRCACTCSPHPRRSELFEPAYHTYYACVAKFQSNRQYSAPIVRVPVEVLTRKTSLANQYQ